MVVNEMSHDPCDPLTRPRDPSAIDQRHAYGSDGNLFSLAILLIVLVLAFGLYFL
jgi:hypothetical protein